MMDCLNRSICLVASLWYIKSAYKAETKGVVVEDHANPIEVYRVLSLNVVWIPPVSNAQGRLEQSAL